MPLCRPRDTIRAAVRCAAPMPSPSSTMMLRARAVAPGSAAPVLDGQARRAVAPSAVRASISSGPADADRIAAQQKVGGVTERGRRAIAGRQLRAGRTGAPGAALAVKAGLEQVLRRDLAAVDQHHQPARRIRGVSRVVFGLDPDVELLPHRQHAAVGGHDPDSRRACRRHRDRHASAVPSRHIQSLHGQMIRRHSLSRCDRVHGACGALAAFGRTTTRRHDDNDETL